MAQQTDIAKEFSGLSGDIFAGQGINDIAFQELLKMLDSSLFLPQVGGDDGAVVEETAEQKLANEEYLKRDHGLAELCKINVKGHQEQVFRLSELFLPRPEDYLIKMKMDRYNKSKMPHLKQTVQQEVLDQRKRIIKAELKRAGEKLRYQASKQHVPSIMTGDLNYLHGDVLTSDHIEFQNKNKYANSKHIAKVATEKKSSSKSYLEQRRKMRSPVQLVEEVKEAAPQEEGKQGPVYLKVDQKSHLVQQIEQNLLEIEKIKEMSTDHEKVREQRELKQQVRQVQERIKSLKGNGEEDVLSQLTPQERLVLKSGFGQDHNDKMRRTHPPLFSMTEMEKSCYEFAMDLDFVLYSYKGQPSMPKSQVGENGGFEAIQSFSSFLGANPTQIGSGNIAQVFDDQQDIIKNSLFAGLLDESLLNSVENDFPSKYKDTEEKGLGEEQEYNIMSQSVGEDAIMSGSRDGDSDRLSCLDDGVDSSRVKQEALAPIFDSNEFAGGAERPAVNGEPKEKPSDPRPVRIPAWLESQAESYRLLERDNKIRNALVQNKYERLKEVNHHVKSVKLNKVNRRKFWGELHDGDSQNQVDKDYTRFTFFENRLPIESKQVEPFFSVEPIADRQKNQDKGGAKTETLQPEQFKTKYGSLALCGAHVNNFKIDDIKEYEFVQKQRAYLYDPLYIKGSAQFKSFSSQVGFGSFINRNSNQKVQKTFDRTAAMQSLYAGGALGASEPTNRLEQTPAMQKIFQSLKKGSGKTEAVDLSLNPQSLLQFDFKEAETQVHQLDYKKQRQIRQNEDVLGKMADDFDQLTDNVKLKKFEECIQRKNDENKKNAQNIKNRNQSTAYRPTDPRPISRGPSQIDKTDGQDLTGEGSQRQIQDGQGAPWMRPGSAFDPKSQEARSSQQKNTGDSYMQPEDNGSGSDGGGHSSFGNSDSFAGANPGQHHHKSAVKARGSRDSLEPKSRQQNEDTEDSTGNDFSDILEIENETFEQGLNQNASHAQCILDLSFTKFKWNINEDFTRFHRPNIQSYFDFERELQKYQFDMERKRREQAPLTNNSTHFNITQDGGLSMTNKRESSGEVDPKNIHVALPVTVVDRETIQRKNRKRAAINADEYFKDRIKLSLKDGKFCVFEHVDQNPIFVNNFGMVSKLDRYLYSDRAVPAKQFLPNAHNPKIAHMGPYGRQVLCRQNQKLPLLGNIDKNLFQGITVLSNKLYRAPVFFHKAKHTDFFCSYFQDKKKDKNGQNVKKIILREIQNVYSVGQIEPIQYVCNPQSRIYQTYIKEHSKAYIIRFLQENKNQVDFKEIQHLFSYLTDQMSKKFIKEISVEVDKHQVCSCTKQLSDETIKNLITPEMICRYESALYGEAMLRMRGIQNITNGDKISYASNKYCSEQRDHLKQKISKFIENEILCTPWNLSSNFCTINQNNGMLMIRGVGDPSNSNGGFSFLKMPLKISNDCFKDCEKIRRQLNPAMQNPKSVTGTDADLRKLKKGDIFDMLIEMGYQREEIRDLSRWDMVGYLRQHSSNHAANDDKKTQRYARGIRYTAKTQREMYHKQVDELFKTQMVYLTGRHHLHDESDYEDPCDQFNIPALIQNSQVDKAPDDSGDELFSQSDPKKFIVEIADPTKVSELCQEKPNDEDPLDPSRPYSRPRSGAITNIQDIPHYKRLLLANIVPNQNQSMQSGPQMGLINIGSNSGPQQDSIMNFKNAEQLLQKRLDEKEMTLKCSVLKKIIKNEEDPSKIERIEFNSDPKALKKFEKRRRKCEYKKDRQKKTGLRQKMQQAQIAAAGQKDFSFKDPLPIAGKSSLFQPDAAMQRGQTMRLNHAALRSFDASNKNAAGATTSIDIALDSGIFDSGKKSKDQNLGLDNPAAPLENTTTIQLDLNDCHDLLGAPDQSKIVAGHSKTRNQTSHKSRSKIQIEQQEDDDAYYNPMRTTQQEQKQRNSTPFTGKKPHPASKNKVLELGQLNDTATVDQLLNFGNDGEFKKPRSSRRGDGSKSNSRQREKASAPENNSKISFPLIYDEEINISALKGPSQEGAIGSGILDFSSQPAEQNSNKIVIGFDNFDLANMKIAEPKVPIKNNALLTDNQFLESDANDGIYQEFEDGDNLPHDQDDEFVINASASQVDQTHNDEEAEVDEDYMPIVDNMGLNTSYPRKQSVPAPGRKQASKRQDRSRVAYKPDNSAAIQMRQQAADQYKRQNQSSRRAKLSGLSVLNNVIEKVIDECCLLDPHMWFKDRVRREVAPCYDQVIKHPMWLGLMRQKCRREEYRSVHEFLSDMERLRRNADIYNGAAHPIAQLAQNIESVAIRLAEESREMIDEATLKIQYM